MSGYLNALIEFPDGDTESLLVTKVGTNLFQLEESPVFNSSVEVHYHDVIEGEVVRGQGLRYVRLERRSGLVTHSWLLTRSAMEAPKVAEFLEGVVAAGGMWEQVLGGMLMLHLPPSEDGRLVAGLWRALADGGAPSAGSGEGPHAIETTALRRPDHRRRGPVRGIHPGPSRLRGLRRRLRARVGFYGELASDG